MIAINTVYYMDGAERKSAEPGTSFKIDEANAAYLEKVNAARRLAEAVGIGEPPVSRRGRKPKAHDEPESVAEGDEPHGDTGSDFE
jgi:hypothetical protein